MNTLADTTPSLPVMLVYGLVILLYLVILRLLMNFLQQLSDKHHHRQSIIDRAIHQMHSHSVDGSMQAFDPYHIAITMIKAAITVISLAAAIVLLVTKTGFATTVTVLVMVVIIAWAGNRWLRSREKVGIVREVRQYIQKGGSTGSVIALSVLLVLLLVVMVSLH